MKVHFVERQASGNNDVRSLRLCFNCTIKNTNATNRTASPMRGRDDKVARSIGIARPRIVDSFTTCLQRARQKVENVPVTLSQTLNGNNTDYTVKQRST